MIHPVLVRLRLPTIQKEELCQYFTEFAPYEGMCRFQPCSHIHEPGCVVKEQLEKGELCQSRYDNYRQMYEEIADQERRKNWRKRNDI